MCGPAGLAFGTRCSIGGAAAELTESLCWAGAGSQGIPKPEDAMAKMAGHSRPRAPLMHLRASRLAAATREMQTLPRQERRRPQAWRAPSNAGTLPASTQLRNLARVCTRRRRRNLRRALDGMTRGPSPLLGRSSLELLLGSGSICRPLRDRRALGLWPTRVTEL